MKRYVYSARSSSNYSKSQLSNSDLYSWADQDQMKQIRKGLESGVDVSLYADPKFDCNQMDEIRIGLEKGVDVSWYADPKFNYRQMQEIRNGLRKGLDVSIYADPKFDCDQMAQIYWGLEDGLDVSWYADPKFGEWQMFQIREGLEEGFDVSTYADPKFDYHQMREIRKGKEGSGNKFRSWKQLVSALKAESADGIDPLYKQTEAGVEIEDICTQIESKMNLFLEPSVEGGQGDMSIFDDTTDEKLGSEDYQTFNSTVLDIAVSSTTKKSFKNGYIDYLESLI